MSEALAGRLLTARQKLGKFGVVSPSGAILDRVIHFPFVPLRKTAAWMLPSRQVCSNKSGHLNGPQCGVPASALRGQSAHQEQHGTPAAAGRAFASG